AVSDEEPVVTERPDNPSENQQWVQISSLSDHNGTYKYYYIVWKAHYDTTVEEGSNSGRVRTYLNGNPIAAGRITVPAGGTLSFMFEGVDTTESVEDYNNGSATISWIESESFKAGILLIKDSSRAASKYIADLSDDVWTTSPSLRLTHAGVLFNLPLNSSSEWDEYCYQVSHGTIHKLFRFHWTSKSNGTFSTFSSQVAAIAVDKNGSTTQAIGDTRTLMSATVGTALLSATWKGRYNSTGTFKLKSSEYYRSYSVDFTPIARTEGVKSKSLTPFVNNSYSLGTETYKWKALHAVKVYADGTELTSSRKAKEDIVEYKNNALNLINNTRIVSFKYKRDHGNKKAHRYIGFIAEDTDEALSTPSHDRMDIGSCIGVLIKAVQELSEQVEKLKGGNCG
ncbi:MAG: tail fiber domain-containing protein, partial [Spirochaetales bacterium]|nr:tail fiber domain-containing protein [Spirochaetales bacterium]